LRGPHIDDHELFGGAVFQLAVDLAPIGIALVSTEGTFLRVNAELCRILGRSTEDLMASSFQAITHPDDLDADLALLEETLAGSRTGYRIEKRYLGTDGTVVWVQLDVVLVREDDRPLYFISQIQDIGPRKEAEDRLRQLALHDALTDLPNRTLFRDRAERALARAERLGHPIAIGFVDLDDFKLVNDTRGHAAGDQLLVQVGAQIQAQLRAGDTVARFGGDEFVILIDDLPDEATATGIADRIVTALKASPGLALEDLGVSASLGLVISTPGTTVDDLLRHADLAMYEAKRRGKDRVAVYDLSLETRVIDRLETEQRLRLALDRQELFPAYQPVISLADGSTLGHEVLARWQHPHAGVVTAAKFIPIAAEAHLLDRLTVQLLDQVEAQVERLTGPDGRCILVNVTPRVLIEVEVRTLLDVIAACCPDPSCLVLEMTESELLRLDSPAATALRDLRATGIRFAVDDFGTGYSSLSMLASLRPDILKIDRSFTESLQEPAATAVVEALCRMAADLGMTTIGEGVEQQEQADRLLALGCDAAQGFLWSPARAIDDLPR